MNLPLSPSTSSNPSGPASPSTPEQTPGLFHQGYGLEIQGYEHRDRTDLEALVFLPQDTRYRIRLSNANDYMCMTTIFIDGISIGTFMLNPFSKCDLERPTDRPLGFTFMQPLTEVGGKPDQGRGKGRTGTLMRLLSQERTCITAVFKPEAGGRIIQVDMTAHHTGKTQRLELLNDTRVNELFSETRRDFGDWILEPKCALIHWTSAEYDSPVEDVLRSDVQTALRSFKRREDPFRKMSLILIDLLEIQIEGLPDPITITLDSLPTFGPLMGLIQEKLKGSGYESGSTIYFLSDSSRLLCSSQWIQDQTCVLDVLHKDEILRRPSALTLKATLTPPTSCFTLIARTLSGASFELLASPETTIRECRYQLEVLGGPWGEDPRWLFGGTLLESGRALGFCGIISRTIIDIIPKVQDTCPFRRLEMRDPIAVDGEKPVDSIELIRREESKVKRVAKAEAKKRQSVKRKPHHKGTTLKGRTKQQYIEVDPIEVDQRFFVELSVAILPKEHEEAIIEAQSQQANLSDQDPANRRSCVIS